MLLDLLKQCTKPQQRIFKRMYSSNDISKPIEEVVSSLPSDMINNALNQTERTINMNNNEW